MRALDLLIKKRDGAELNHDELQYLISGYVDGKIPEYQIAAFLMSVFFQGMTEHEISELTEVMIDSGHRIDLRSLKGHISGRLVDKHSTGGVGDKTSLILAPIVATAGIQVPMMSGRGLGHTGGTLDKLESIPGYSTDLSPDDFTRIINACGFAMMGQSEAVVRADKKLYALRDVTGTVESVPLITASILSKKCAEGAQYLVFDVKYGSGAFMKNLGSARVLAESLVRVARELGLGVKALITNMDSPLGVKVGNFLEVEESIACLSCEGWKTEVNSDTRHHFVGKSADLMELTCHLAAHMLLLGGVVENITEGMSLSLESLYSGRALDCFWKNVELQGGRRRDCEKAIGNRTGLYSKSLFAEAGGYLQSLDAYRIGHAAVLLGAGRNFAGDEIQPDVGIELHAKPGDLLEKGARVLTLYARENTSLETVAGYLSGDVKTGDGLQNPNNLIHSII